MLGVLTMVAALTAGALSYELPLANPDTLREAQGVRLQPRLPDEIKVLIERAPENDSLWYAPGAVRSTPEGVEIWYQRVEKKAKEYMDQRTLCLGILKNNGSFVMPEISPEPPAWGGPNNVVMRRSPHPPTWGGFNVFQMAEKDQQLYLLYWDQPEKEGEAGAMLARSSDGRVWEKLPGAVFTEHNDAYTLMKQDRKWILYQTMLEDWPDKPYKDNLGLWRRVQCLRESEDLVHWTGQTPLLKPDAQDPPTTEFYLMKAFPFQGVYLGLLMKYFSDPAKPNEHSGIIVNELMYSKDARNWERPWRDVDIGFWGYPDPFRHDGKLKFVTWKDNAMVTMGYENGAMLAVVADDEGSFVTPSVGGHSTFNILYETTDGSIEITPVLGGKPMEDYAPHHLPQAGRNSSGDHPALCKEVVGWKPSLPPGSALKFVLRNAAVLRIEVVTVEVS